MEWMNGVWSQVANYISIPYFLTFILLAFAGNRYFGVILQKVTRFNWQPVYTVLALATLLAIPFLIWTKTGWVQVIFSYALGFALHELIFKYITKLFNGKKK
jgi:hypothetical protein